MFSKQNDRRYVASECRQLFKQKSMGKSKYWYEIADIGRRWQAAEQLLDSVMKAYEFFQQSVPKNASTVC